MYVRCGASCGLSSEAVRQRPKFPIVPYHAFFPIQQLFKCTAQFVAKPFLVDGVLSMPVLITEFVITGEVLMKSSPT